ncbi:hypothetical protein VP01_1035g5 [Puccinia sorghi]|uniref:Uncharacterized protein n=1 Tax=Puccinia sorghi TaxID=27349 RepID=A0A0L6VVX8_9BASI|nr:hypothetical protein VP01_1035g5 [Puccinia sorghi]
MKGKNIVNKSKKWNKHISFYMTLYGLRPNMKNMGYNCNFLATSNVADLSTQGCLGFDPYLQQEVLIMSIALTFLADSPMAAEVTNTPNPGSSNNPCRICYLRVDLSDHKHNLPFIYYISHQRNMGFITNRNPGCNTQSNIKTHLFHLNHLMDVKTPQLKYYMSISWLKEILGSWQLFNTDSTNIPPIQPQYMIKYYKSFIERDMAIVLANLTLSIQNLLYHISQMNARWVHKSRIHILFHLPESISRFGPPSLFATEIFENIAITSSNYQTIRLLLSGTYYFYKHSEVYFQASQKVPDFFLNTQIIQRTMGYNSPMLLEGEETPTLYDHKVRSEDQTKFPKKLQEIYPKFHICQISSVSINYKLVIKQRSFVFSLTSPVIRCLLIGPGAGTIQYVHLLWEVFPVVKILTEKLIKKQKITHGINVQHNCIDGGCKTFQANFPCQNCQEDSCTSSFVVKSSNNSYIINRFSHQ